MQNYTVYINHYPYNKDIALSNSLYYRLKEAGYNAFVGAKKIQSIESHEEALKLSDFYILLLSKQSQNEESLPKRLKKALELKSKDKIEVIVIRIDLTSDLHLKYIVSGLLTNITQKYWNSSESPGKITEEIVNLLEDTAYLQSSEAASDIAGLEDEPVPLLSVSLESPGGNVGLKANYYIVRAGEEQFRNEILKQGALLRIKGPRQFGKTSLLARIIQLAKQKNHAVVPFSFQQIGIHYINNLEKLLKLICTHTSRKIGVEDKTREFWTEDIDPKIKCTAYFEDYILMKCDKPILLALDEADRLFEFEEVSSEFFGLIRFWNEERNNNEIWNNLKIAVSHSTEVYLAISNLNQSPFNIGVERVLQELNNEQVSDFAERMGVALNHRQVEELMGMIGGHPYLVHKALYEIASGNYSFEELLENAASEEGPFAEHLRRHSWYISQNLEFSNAMKEIVEKGYSNNTRLCYKFQAAGLIKGTTPNVKARFKVYDQYFKQKMRIG